MNLRHWDHSEFQGKVSVEVVMSHAPIFDIHGDASDISETTVIFILQAIIQAILWLEFSYRKMVNRWLSRRILTNVQETTEEGAGEEFFNVFEELKLKAVIEKDKTPKEYVDVDDLRSVNVFVRPQCVKNFFFSFTI